MRLAVIEMWKSVHKLDVLLLYRVCWELQLESGKEGSVKDVKFDELPCYSGEMSCLIVQASLFQAGSAFLNHSAYLGGQVIFHDIPHVRIVALNGSCVLGERIICVGCGKC